MLFLPLLLLASVANAVDPTTLYYYIDDAGMKIGPVPVDDIKVAYYQGRISRESKLYRQGETDWQNFFIYTDLVESFNKDRPYDPRSPLLMDVQQFIAEANTIPFDPDQLEYEKLFCSRQGAFESVLRKDKLRRMITDMVPELKDLLDDVREMGEQSKELIRDVEMSHSDYNKTLRQYMEDIVEIRKLIKEETDRLELGRNVSVVIRAWQIVKSVLMDTLHIWETIVGFQLFKPFSQVQGLYVFVIILFVFFVLAQCSGRSRNKGAKNTKSKRD